MDRQNVEYFIEEFKELLTVLNVDICHSELQDKWFVFRTEGVYANGYDFFFEVKDESELAAILLSELAYDMHVTLGDDDYDMPECEENNIGDIIDEYRKWERLPELVEKLKNELEKDA